MLAAILLASEEAILGADPRASGRSPPLHNPRRGPIQAKFWLGMLAGATMSLYMALRDSPPCHIEKWRIGQEGERRTAKALRKLPSSDRKAWHDLPG